MLKRVFLRVSQIKLNVLAGDDVYQPLLKLFTAEEIADLTFTANLMNAFNRLTISMRQ